MADGEVTSAAKLEVLFNEVAAQIGTAITISQQAGSQFTRLVQWGITDLKRLQGIHAEVIKHLEEAAPALIDQELQRQLLRILRGSE